MNTSNLVLIVIMCTFAILALAVLFWLSWKNRDTCSYRELHREAPPKDITWYPLLVSELKEGVIYRSKLTGLYAKFQRVLINCNATDPDVGIVQYWNAVKGEWETHQVHDKELETDDIELAPRALAAQNNHLQNFLAGVNFTGL